jgi:Phage terminase large subunit (GpA)
VTPETKSIAEQNAIAKVTAAAWRGVGKSFRGEIYDYARTFTLGSGYLGDWQLTNLCRLCRAKGNIRTCRHFEIDTARHLIGPFKAILDPNVRIVMLLKAAQTAGSLVWDLTVHYLLVHSPYMRVKVLMDSEEKARNYCVQRLMETLRNNPDILPLLPTGAMRFGVTDTEMRLLNGKTLFVGGLNETNASSLPADVMILDEGWLHQSDGLMKKAFNRVKQSQKRGKLIIVGQAGDKGEDQDGIWEGLNIRVPLTWACPRCKSRQPFGERGPSKLRPHDFKPHPMVADKEDAPKPETYAGLLTKKRHNEVSTPEEIDAAAATAYLECFHCGHQMQDNRETREAINATFEQEYRQQLPNGTYCTPKNYSVGFWQPDPASMFVPWKSTMKEYIVAKKADDDFKNKVPLRDFFKANWALPWDENLVSVFRARTQEKYDMQSDWPEEWRGHRCFIIDCQYELQHFWGSAFAVSKNGKSRQLWRGLLRGFGVNTDKMPADGSQPPTISAVQKNFGIFDQFVFLDGAYMKEMLVEECAKHGHWGSVDGEPAWFCWTLLVGSPQKDFSHYEEKNSKSRHPVSDPFYEYPKFKVDYRGRKATVSVEVFYFSKLQTSQMFARYRDGNGPETLFLPETEPVENQLSWTAQIHACTPHYDINKATGEAREIWRPEKQTTPHHYFDVGTMFCAVLCAWGLSGHREFEELPTVNKAG